MKKLSIAAAFFLIFCASTLLQAKTLFHDDFSDGDNWQDNWYLLGSKGCQILQVGGHLEIVAGKLMAQKQTSAVTKEKYDFTNGTTFEGVLTSAGPDEVQFWVANEDGKGQAEDDPWFTKNWLRVMLHNNSVYIQRAKPGGEGMAGEGNVPMTVGTPYKISIYMEIKTYKVYVDGKKIIEGKHEQDFTKGYLIFAAWTGGAAINENHKLDDVFVYEGDYDPNPSFSVKIEGKLAKTWGRIK
jgi:hypothetical protein